jgi:hypothetical protein
VPLAASAYAVLPYTQLVADGGYDSEANHRYCREGFRVESPIPARNRRGSRAKTTYRRQMQRLLGVRGTERHGARPPRLRSAVEDPDADERLKAQVRRVSECARGRNAAVAGAAPRRRL